MNKRISLGVTIALMLIAAAATYTVTSVTNLSLFNSMVANVSEREAMYEKLSEIDLYVREYYAGTIDEEALKNALAEGYLEGISDSYSTYYSASEVAQMKLTDSGYIVGIGIEMTLDSSGYGYITNVWADSPAEQSGLKVGDLIVKIGDTDVVGLTLTQMQELMSGSEGQALTITVRSDLVDTEKSIIRSELEIESVTGYMVDDVAIITITTFNSTTASQFNQVLSQMTSAGATSIVFDLRNNGGGLLSATADILDTLLPEGTIMSSVSKDGTEEVLYTSNSLELDMPMIVLVNENTASAAELFACAIRDYGKGVLVGTTTYGKGVYQSYYELTDGSVIEFTVGYLNPPVSDNYDGVGLVPDYEVTLTDEQSSNFYLLDETSDPQILKALEIMPTIARTL